MTCSGMYKNAQMFNYADDNTLSVSSTSLDAVVELLKVDTVNTMKWFSDN